MLLAHKIRIYPTKEQERYLRTACDASRWAYNWALALNQSAYNGGKISGKKPIKTSAFDCSKLLTMIIDSHYPWLRQVSRSILERDLANAERALKNFFAKRAGYPRFHSKYSGKDSFYCHNATIKFIGDKRLKLSKCGEIKMAEELRFDGKVMGATISRRADRWYIAVQVETEAPPQIHGGKDVRAAGVDLGIKAWATVSDGTEYQIPDELKLAWKKLRRLGRQLSRKQGARKGEPKSKNFEKAKTALAKQYARMSDLRNEYTHKMTTELTNNFGLIGLETLNLRGLTRSHKLARELLTRNLGEVARQIEYKAAIKGGKVIRADTFFPSSKLCSVCGYKFKDMTLKDRKWTCPECGTHHDRDLNAAINLKKLAETAA